MNLALWFDVLVHVWNGDLWCCDDVNDSVDNNKKKQNKTKQKQSTICDQMEVCVWASGWSLLQDFSFVTLLPAHSSWKTGEAQGTGWHTMYTHNTSKDLGNKGKREREEAGNSWRRQWAVSLPCYKSALGGLEIDDAYRFVELCTNLFMMGASKKLDTSVNLISTYINS